MKKQFKSRNKQLDADSEVSLKNTKRSSSNIDTTKRKVLSALKQDIIKTLKISGQGSSPDDGGIYIRDTCCYQISNMIVDCYEG